MQHDTSHSTECPLCAEIVILEINPDGHPMAYLDNDSTEQNFVVDLYDDRAEGSCPRLIREGEECGGPLTWTAAK